MGTNTAMLLNDILSASLSLVRVCASTPNIYPIWIHVTANVGMCYWMLLKIMRERENIGARRESECVHKCVHREREIPCAQNACFTLAINT